MLYFSLSILVDFFICSLFIFEGNNRSTSKDSFNYLKIDIFFVNTQTKKDMH